ncbi:MAG: mechanosensitive ion channel family protein [Treponema sp.]|jgi:small-conductance mechanosensitive channel|nr:mechanosensitive ion channel family protein [Treponema sp.]
MKRIPIFVLLAFFCLPLHFSAAQEGGDAVPAGEAAPVVPAASAPLEPATEAEAASREAAPEEPAGAVEEETITEELEEAFAGNRKIALFARKLGIALAVIVGQILLIWLVWQLFKRLSKKAIGLEGEKIKPLTIKKIRIFTARQIIDIIQFFLRILKYLITVFQLFLTVPIVFSLFPATEKLASTLFGYILTPIKEIVVGVIKYIPNLFTIIIIIFITRYVIRALKFFSVQITRGKLVIHGFYADWAEPTYKILQVLLWAFTVAVVYPYLPGSDSRIFQGVSVFVGIIFSMGSTSAIGNLVAGLVITYMRPFKIGDRVMIKDITGFVVKKDMMVVRLKTHKNEYVTFPNMIILSSSIINYNTSSDEDAEGLILNTSITFGYATPWQTVHEILIKAALATDYVQKNPKPFVLQTAMDDFYAHYQINCYTKEVDKVPAIYAQLYENIQNGFHGAGIDMTAAHYQINRIAAD